MLHSYCQHQNSTHAYLHRIDLVDICIVKEQPGNVRCTIIYYLDSTYKVGIFIVVTWVRVAYLICTYTQ